MNLQHSFLNEDSLVKLKRSGIFSVKQFLDADENKIQKLTQLSTADIGVVKNYFQTMYETYLPVTLEEHTEVIRSSLKENHVFATGIVEFDKRLKGIPQGSLIEINGDPESGKSKLCMSITINILTKYYNCEVYWIDTKMDFTSIGMEREMREKFPSNDLKLQAMKKIHVERKFTIEGVIETLEYLMKNERIKAGLLILDSLSAVLFGKMGKKRFISRDEGLKKIGSYLRNLCVKKKFTVIVTTLLKSEKSKECQNILYEYASDCLLMSQKQKEEEEDLTDNHKRNISVVKSFLGKNGESFCVTLGDTGVV